MLDARKPLPLLHQEWSSCTKCSLGQRRVEVGGHFVAGTGVTRSVMLIGEGPGVDEEKKGVPFVGKSGKLLREVLHLLGLNEYYLTNLVTCRSCSVVEGPDGLPITRKVGWGKNQHDEIVYKDEPPLPVQYKECLPRLHEEIYLVDPIVVVGLGGTISKALLGDNITITKERGDYHHIEVPGAAFSPALTEKKRMWGRKKDGAVEAPTEQNMVRYLFVPTLHPTYVAKKIADRGLNSPFRDFAKDLKKVAQIYEDYVRAVTGRSPTSLSEKSESDIEAEYYAAAQRDNEEP